ncbi:MAG: thiamine phosphate synthase [Bacteroidaceae bacterium]|nr:thiamine phosphate synthase [Bacteroidaceae bacterium]
MNIQFRTSELDAVRRVLRQGCRWVRLAFPADVDDEQARPVAEEALALCRQHDAVLIIDDRPTLCLAVKADGIHLADADRVSEVRKQLGEEPIVGVSVGDYAAARHARAFGADYLDCGPLDAVGLDGVRALVLALYEDDLPVPVSVFGHVTPQDIPALSATGARGVTTDDEAFFDRDAFAFIDKIS